MTSTVNAKKAAKQKEKDRLHTEYMKGYRVGFDKGHAAGKKDGRDKLQEELQILLNVPSAKTDEESSYW